MLSKNDVVTLQRHLSVFFQCRYITSLLRYSVLSVFYLCRHTTSYVTTSFVCVLSVSLYNVVVMLQSHLSVFFLCRHRTSLLCYSVFYLCRHITSYVTTSFVCVLSVSLYNDVVMFQRKFV